MTFKQAVALGGTGGGCSYEHEFPAYPTGSIKRMCVFEDGHKDEHVVIHPVLNQPMVCARTVGMLTTSRLKALSGKTGAVVPEGAPCCEVCGAVLTNGACLSCGSKPDLLRARGAVREAIAWLKKEERMSPKVVAGVYSLNGPGGPSVINEVYLGDFRAGLIDRLEAASEILRVENNRPDLHTRLAEVERERDALKKGHEHDAVPYLSEPKVAASEIFRMGKSLSETAYKDGDVWLLSAREIIDWQIRERSLAYAWAESKLRLAIVEAALQTAYADLSEERRGQPESLSIEEICSRLGHLAPPVTPKEVA